MDLNPVHLRTFAAVVLAALEAWSRRPRVT